MSDHTILVIQVIKTFFVQFFCVFLTPFLISSASVRPIPFLSFIALIFAWNVPLVSLIFLKRYLVFPSLFFPSISLHFSVKKTFLSLLASWNCAFRCLYLYFSPLPLTSLLFLDVLKAFLHQPYCQHKKSGEVEEISEKEERRSNLRPEHPRGSGQPSAVLLSLFLGPWEGRWKGAPVAAEPLPLF